MLKLYILSTFVISPYTTLSQPWGGGHCCVQQFPEQRDQSFFPARTVRSDHVAAVAFRKIRSHFYPPFFVGWDYFFHAFFPLSSTLTDITKHHAKLIANTGQRGRNLEGILTMLASPI
jgi:hypothetical protein